MENAEMLIPPIVTTSYGSVQGRLITTPKDVTYYSFQGIRYAKPPINRMRFRDPEPMPYWSGLYIATKEGNPCAQSDVVIQQKQFAGSEDCLFLNVFTSTLLAIDSTMLLPVMVWIHGGGFFAGSGSIGQYGPDYLIRNGVVTVTLNYRLGILGFLSLENKEVPGNAGLKDIVLALKWVRDNIAKFGGDPNNVTIFGESAGGAAVQYLMLSNMAKGLFHKAISQSGSCLNQWAHTTKNADNPIQNAIEISKMVGHEQTDPDKLLEFLISLRVEDLVKLSHKTLTFEDKRRDAPFTFAPIVEKEFPDVEAFLTKRPIDIMESGLINNVPYLAGYNAKEAILWMINIKNDENYLSEYNKNFQYFVPLKLGFPMNSKESKAIAYKVRKFYFGDAELNNKTLGHFIDLMTDHAFLKEIILSTKTLSKTISPIYLYRFSYDGDLNFFKKKFKIDVPGSSHEDDLGYIFNLEDDNSTFATTVRERMVKMWTNFAKFGNPTPEVTELLPTQWLPVTEEDLNFIEISENLEMKKNPEEERMHFWQQLYEEYKK